MGTFKSQHVDTVICLQICFKQVTVLFRSRVQINATLFPSPRLSKVFPAFRLLEITFATAPEKHWSLSAPGLLSPLDGVTERGKEA